MGKNPTITISGDVDLSDLREIIFGHFKETSYGLVFLYIPSWCYHQVLKEPDVVKSLPFITNNISKELYIWGATVRPYDPGQINAEIWRSSTN